MIQRCLIIADDLTGGADTGAQFARKGLNTFLIPLIDRLRIDFSKYSNKDVLVISTNSRGLNSEDAFRLVSNLLKGNDVESFSVIYKKIDSTLRGNIGYEVDAILKNTYLSMGFMAPSFPEQGRTVAGGILMVKGIPLSLTETARDAVSPVKESYVHKLLEIQSSYSVGRIDLVHVASGGEVLQRAADEANQKGTRILVFDAVTRRDLTHIAETAYRRWEKPLLIGSAGLAEEVAKKIAPPRLKKRSPFLNPKAKPFKHILIVSGSASKVSHEQLKRAEQTKRIPSFQLDHAFMTSNEAQRGTLEDQLSHSIKKEIAKGHAILKMSPEKILPKVPGDPPVHLDIPKRLGRITKFVLERSDLDIQDFAVVLFGGDTTLSVLNLLEIEGIEIEGELIKGIVMGRLMGGKWHGLRVITKAGAFGKKNALEKMMEVLGGG